jgi:acetyltransferase
VAPEHPTPVSQPGDYPAHLIREWTLASGEVLTVRPLRHDDGPLEEAFVRSLSRETGYQRLLSGGTKITAEWIEKMTHIDYRRHMAFAVTTGNGVAERFVAVGRYVIGSDQPVAEFALVIADAWQRKGLGKRLLDLLMEHARLAGVKEIFGITLATNAAMLGLARSMGFAVAAEAEDPTVRRVSRMLA